MDNKTFDRICEQIQIFDGNPLLQRDYFMEDNDFCYTVNSAFYEKLLIFMTPIISRIGGNYLVSFDFGDVSFFMAEGPKLAGLKFSWEFFLKHNG